MNVMSERITRDAVAHIATLAKLAVTDAELDEYTRQLGAVLDHAADVEAIDVDDVAPTAHPFHLVNVFRPDVVGPTLDTAEVLAQAPSVEDHRFRVPAILGEEP
jgi:aspartyl-tRNA(Asn)/glutamyl-tRNA(Gln) amidotransferase subunit C